MLSIEVDITYPRGRLPARLHSSVVQVYPTVRAKADGAERNISIVIEPVDMWIKVYYGGVFGAEQRSEAKAAWRQTAGEAFEEAVFDPSPLDYRWSTELGQCTGNFSTCSISYSANDAKNCVVPATPAAAVWFVALKVNTTGPGVDGGTWMM